MCKLFIKKTNIKLLFITLSLLAITNAQAKKLDLEQEIKISSAKQAADLKNKIFSYIDNVVISQGTLKINADLVQVLTQENTENKIYIAKGTPATFSQILDDGTPIYLQATEIRYEPGNFIIIMSGKAILKQEGSEVSGSRITYNFKTEYVSAESNDDEIVKTVLQPKNINENINKNKSK